MNMHTYTVLCLCVWQRAGEKSPTYVKQSKQHNRTADRIEEQLKASDSGGTWQGLHIISDFREKKMWGPSLCASLPDELNSFYTRFEVTTDPVVCRLQHCITIKPWNNEKASWKCIFDEGLGFNQWLEWAFDRVCTLAWWLWPCRCRCAVEMQTHASGLGFCLSGVWMSSEERPCCHGVVRCIHCRIQSIRLPPWEWRSLSSRFEDQCI